MNVLNCWAAEILIATTLGSSLSVNTLQVWFYHSEHSVAISSLITPEIEHDGAPAFFFLFPPSLKAAVRRALPGSAEF